jgi:arylsulfatase A-like enzyme
MKFLHAVSLPILALAGLASSCGDSPAPSDSETGGAKPGAGTAFRPETAPNFLIFLIDTQRADYMGLYGNPRDTTPNIDAFAQQSLVFDRAFAPASSTSPSHASLFTSTYPRVHGVWNRVPRGEDEPIFPALSPNATTLAEVLGEIGYDTAAICDGGNLQSNRGFDQGFRTWDSKYLGVDNRVDRALSWLDHERKQDQPFFLFLHTYQVHTPYLPQPEHVALFADPEYQGPVRKAWEGALAFYNANPGLKGAIRKIQGDFYRPTLPEDEFTSPEPDDLAFMLALYQASTHQVDAAFARLMRELKTRGITSDNTLFLITSDHGEEFWEHGQYGHHQIYEPTAHIPFIFDGPGVKSGARRADPVDLLDVMPTLLHWSGMQSHSMPPSMMGRILDLGSTEAPAPHPIIGETNWPENQVSWRDQERKAMYFPESERATEVYRYADDPLESNDRATAEAAWLAEIQAPRAAWEASAAAWQEEHQLLPGIRDWNSLSPAEQRALVAMGYVGEGELEVKKDASEADEDGENK